VLWDEGKSKAHVLHGMDKVTNDGDECPVEKLVLAMTGGDEIGSWKVI
jgi:hypothetical protein